MQGLTIKNWSAKRAGAGITIDGVWRDGDKPGRPVKLTGVEEITIRNAAIVAVHDGRFYTLHPVGE